VYEVHISLGDQTYRTVLQDLQFDPVRDHILHADFMRLVDDKPVNMEVPIRLLGNARGVRSGGKLKQNMRKLTVRALPAHLPDDISIDISDLRIGQSIKVEDVKRDGYEIKNSGGAVIVSIKTSRNVVIDEDDAAEAPAAEAAAEA
jgi:large subunit ribosomal protein L25